jgi:hypothetical protein
VERLRGSELAVENGMFAAEIRETERILAEYQILTGTCGIRRV